MKQLTKEEAIKFYDSKVYENMDLKSLAEFQLNQDLLCIPFELFQKAMTEALGRPVWTHEFANRERLLKEFYKERPKATFEDIMSMIPEEKRVMVFV